MVTNELCSLQQVGLWRRKQFRLKRRYLHQNTEECMFVYSCVAFPTPTLLPWFCDVFFGFYKASDLCLFAWCFPSFLHNQFGSFFIFFFFHFGFSLLCVSAWVFCTIVVFLFFLCTQFFKFLHNKSDDLLTSGYSTVIVCHNSDVESYLPVLLIQWF